MGLAATLTTKLDCSSVGSALLGQLQGPSGDLAAIALPLPQDQLNGVTGAAGNVNANPLAGAVAQLAGRIPGALSALPQADAIVRPLTGALELGRQLAANDVSALFDQTLARVRAELQAPPAGGHAALLLRVAESLRTAPAGQSLGALISALVPALERGSAAAFPFLDILRGVEGATQILGGLMCLETVLAEAQRLAANLGVRLDPAGLTAATGALAAELGGSNNLAARLAAVDAGDAGTLQQLSMEVIAAASQLAALREAYAAGMAMDEATLAYLDIARLSAELDAARAMIRTADADPARRVTEALATLAQPVLAFQLPATPAGGLDALIDAAEAQVAQIAAEIDALDLNFLTGPITSGLNTLTAPLRQVQNVLDSVMAALRGALDQVRAAVAALPLDDLANTLQQFVAPIAQALDAVRALVEGIEAALQAAADATGAALGQVDGALDAFKQQIDAFFGEARSAVEQVNLDQAVGAVAGEVRKFADLLAQAQMQPYFDAAVSAIDTATDVVEAVPFDLLPESMKADVDAAVAPIKAVNVDAVEAEIETLLGVGADGKFALRGELDQAIEQIYQKFQALLDVVEQNSPRTLLAEVDAKLDELAEKVRTLAPDLDLQPVRDALDGVKNAVRSLDLDALLAPVREAFALITGALDQLSVAALVAPVQEQLTEVRTTVIQAIRLDQWEDALNGLRRETLALLERVNPAQLRAPLEGAFADLAQALARFPGLNAGAGMGVVVAAMLGATGRRIQPSSFGPVLGWLGGASGSGELSARSGAVALSLANARALVEQVDPAAAGSALNARFAELAAAVQALVARLAADAPVRATLSASVAVLDSASLFADLTVQRARYLAALGAAAQQADAFRRAGFSEADSGTAALNNLLAPLAPAGQKVRGLMQALGFAPDDISVAGVVRTLLKSAPPERIAGIATPVFEALHRRLAALLDAVLNPLLAATADLRHLIDSLDLAPLIAAADGIVAQAKTEIESLSPDKLLAAPIASFNQLKAAILEQDPLDKVNAILAGLRELIARVLEKLNLETLLEVPLEIYDHILEQVRAIDPRGLMNPVFDQLDVIAGQVDGGLDATVASFKRLQDALPAGGGGSSGSASGSVSL
ncbi:MAG: hypothetical protein JNJ60_04775 [Rhodocyclaceae bacterium]|nr:hypothetical protein [Rhodocyclaceae bacterium]